MTTGTRLAIVNAVVVALLLILLGAGLYALVELALLESLDGLLHEERGEIASALSQGIASGTRLQELVDLECGEHRAEGFSARVTDPAGQVLASGVSPFWAAVPPLAGQAAESSAPITVRVAEEEARFRWVGGFVTDPQRGPLWVEAVVQLRGGEASLARVRQWAAGGLVAIIVVSTAAGLFLSRRALRPVEALEQAARRVGERAGPERLPDPGTADELGRLARTLNAMLARLEEARARNLRFAADVAHELRTPLTVIRTLCEPRAGEGADGEQRRRAEMAAEVERLETLVRTLLLIAQAEESGPRLARALVDLARLVADTVEFFRPLAESREPAVALALSAPEGRPVPVLGDDGLLRRAVGNLLQNAIRHARASVRVAVEAGEGHARARIEDDGDGVPEADRARLFERFFRAEASRASDPGGAGLGLSLVRATARAHGGEARHAPREGGGSVFTLEVPLAAETAEAPPRAGVSGPSRS